MSDNLLDLLKEASISLKRSSDLSDQHLAERIDCRIAELETTIAVIKADGKFAIKD